MVREIVCLDKTHVSSLLGESLLRTKVGIVSMAGECSLAVLWAWLWMPLESVLLLDRKWSIWSGQDQHVPWMVIILASVLIFIMIQHCHWGVRPWKKTLSLWHNEYLGQLVTLWLDQCVKLEPQKTFHVFSVLLQLLLAWPIDSVIVWCPYLQTGQFPSARLFDLWGLTLYWFTWG